MLRLEKFKKMGSLDGYGRSTLSAVLFHIMLEIVANLGLVLWYKQQIIYNVLFISFVAIGITVIFGAKTLVRKREA